MLRQQLVPENLARLAAPGHRIDVHVREVLLGLGGVVAVCEHGSGVVEHSLEEIILDVSPPQGFAIIFLEVLDLIAGMERVVRTSRRILPLARGGRLG